MPTLFDPTARAALLDRVDRLTPDARRVWGKMSLGQMLAHTAGQLRLGLGEMPVKRMRTPYGFPVLRQLAIYVVPWPKGAPSAPELLAVPPAEVEAGKAAVRECAERFGALGPDHPWPLHPAFGRLSRRAWGVLSWRHLDHHLRQFGV
ncbi:MAG TPA: DUF1569 domain-containing protein [Rhodothermales bacterium]|nr:DUF1569 domain-containing protein [Rhodothermales bacterium]